MLTLKSTSTIFVSESITLKSEGDTHDYIIKGFLQRDKFNSKLFSNEMMFVNGSVV